MHTNLTRQSWVLVFLLIGAATVPVAGAAATVDAPPAQTAPTGSTMTSEVVGSSNESCTETIDTRTAICSASVTAEGRLTLVLYSDVTGQRVTLTDSGDFMEGGSVSYTEVTLQEGKNRIRWTINTDARASGVGINTARAIHSKWVDPPMRLLPGSPSIFDSVLVGSTVVGLFVVGMPVTRWAYKRNRGGERDVL